MLTVEPRCAIVADRTCEPRAVVLKLRSRITTPSATFRAILDEFRYRYLVTYTPKNVPKDGWDKLEVRSIARAPESRRALDTRAASHFFVKCKSPSVECRRSRSAF